MRTSSADRCRRFTVVGRRKLTKHPTYATGSPLLLAPAPLRLLGLSLVVVHIDAEREEQRRVNSRILEVVTARVMPENPVERVARRRVRLVEAHPRRRDRRRPTFLD